MSALIEYPPNPRPLLREAGGPPYTHSLMILANKARIDISERYEQLAEFMEFHIEARYPDDKKSFYNKCTEEFARAKFAEIALRSG